MIGDDDFPPDDLDDPPRFTCCGGLECHKLGCDFDDDDTDAIASTEDEEDEDAEEWPGEAD